jgi:Na+(H+)/acetate symporter ActP
MTIDPYILTFSALTVIATVWMGFWAARKSKTASDFYVAGRSVSVGWNASAISGEYLSAASFMGVAGMVMSSGYDALWYPVCYACGYLFLLLFIAGPLRRFGAYTIPDFAEGRYDSMVFRKIAVVFVLFIGFFYTMPQMKGAGTTLAYIFPGLPYWAGVVLVGAVITLNVALGGMKGITLVQAFQYWAKMFAISVPIFVLMAVYGHYGKQLEVNGKLEPRTANLEPRPASTNDGDRFKVQDSEFMVESSEVLKALAEKAPTELSLAPPESLRSEYTLSMKYLETKVAGVRVHIAQTGTNFTGHVMIGTNTVAIPDAVAGAIYRHHTNRIPQNEFNWNTTRKALPLNAPADRAWIDPFGPLTTEAGKAPKLSPVDTSPYVMEARRQLPDQVSDAHTDAASVSISSLPPDVTQPIAAPSLSLAAPTGGTAQSERIVEMNPVALSKLTLGTLSSTSSVIGGQIHPGSTTIYLDLGVTGIRLPDRVSEVLLERERNRFLSRFQTETFQRQPLPDKAPKDETWLNPFGPLTTKAAKAAKLSVQESRPYALLYTYSLIIALVCGTAGLPHILVRFYTNPDGVAAKRTTMWVMILIGVFYLFPPIFGVMGRNLLPELYSGVGAKGTDKVVLELPRILNQSSERAENQASERRSVGASESESGRAPRPDARHARTFPWGSILSGITCAGAFAAFMSTFSGLLVSMTGALAHDVYGRMLRPKSSPEQRMRAFRICAVMVGAVAILLGMQVEPFQINFMVGQAFAIAAASYFPLLFMSAWWRGMTMKGAATGMLTGGTLALLGISLTSFSDLKWLPLDAFWAAHPLVRILCEQPAIWTVPLAITLMIVVSKLTAKEIPADIRMKMLVLHAPEKLGLKQEYIQEHQHGH